MHNSHNHVIVWRGANAGTAVLDIYDSSQDKPLGSIGQGAFWGLTWKSATIDSVEEQDALTCS